MYIILVIACTFVTQPQVPKPLVSPTGLKGVSSPKPFGASRGAFKSPGAESAAKLAQKKADEETQRRIRAWKAEQEQSKAVSIFRVIYT